MSFRICPSSRSTYYKIHLTILINSPRNLRILKFKKKKKNVDRHWNSFKMHLLENWMLWIFLASILDSWVTTQRSKYLRFRKVWFLTLSDATELMEKFWLLQLIRINVRKSGVPDKIRTRGCWLRKANASTNFLNFFSSPKFFVNRNLRE